MPEFGMMFKFNADYDRIRWYGLGPEETYADRQQGARLGIFEKTVEENFARYLVPQECGNHCGVRRLDLTDHRGRGVTFFGEDLSINVLPWTPHEIENAAHAYELPQVHYTVVRVALGQMGIPALTMPMSREELNAARKKRREEKEAAKQAGK